MSARPAVVLVHGLWMNKYVCVPLAVALRRQGYTPYCFGYPSLRGGLAGNAARLAVFTAGLAEDRVHFVGHSLGGLVVLQAMMDHGSPRVDRAVLLGTPVRGSQVAASLMTRPGGRWLIGNSLPQWNAAALDNYRGADGQPAAWPRIGVIAGSFRLGVASLFSGALPQPNDGAVSVAETRLPGAGHITLPVSHTGLLVSGKVTRGIADFLKTGFFHEGGDGD